MILKTRTLTLERTFDAPIDLVWEAWTQTEHIGHWWAPPGIELEIVEHDFQEGGNWKYLMKMKDGNAFVAEGQYERIEAPTLLVTSANFRPMTEGVTMEVHLKADGNKTQFTFNVIHPTVEYCKAQEEMGFYNGWGSAFERLAGMLEG